jgi:hypothetical protein
MERDLSLFYFVTARFWITLIRWRSPCPSLPTPEISVHYTTQVTATAVDFTAITNIDMTIPLLAQGRNAVKVDQDYNNW